LKALMNNLAVVDLRNIYEAKEIERLGFDYEGVGRKKRKPGDRPSLAAGRPKAVHSNLSRGLILSFLFEFG
jgi:hypothetical protein